MNRGFTALIAPPGMGKTTLLFQFLHDLQNSARSVFVFETQCEPLGLLRYILRDLGLAPAPTGDEMHEQLKDVLLKEARAGRKVVVVVDEAQNLSDQALEMLRLLTNFETPRAKLLQIVLAGQPALADKLMKPSLEQLRQRVSTICRLEPFSMVETAAYVRHRLEQAGYHGAPLFRKDALEQILTASHGIPRIINTLCFNALSTCRALNHRQVDGDMAAEVIADLELNQQAQRIPGLTEEAKTADFPQPGLRTRPAEPKPAASIKKRLVSAAVVLLVSALCALGVAVSGRSWSHFGDYTRSFDKWLSSAAFLSPSAANAGEVKVAEPSPDAEPPATDVSFSPNRKSTVTNTRRAATPEPLSNSQPFQIQVAANQTLRDIALLYLGTWDVKRLHEIQALNPNLTNLDYIQAGQKMWLPAPEPAVVATNVALQANERKTP
jgi:type II secretory pathway predicted ATPase ExeA